MFAKCDLSHNRPLTRTPPSPLSVRAAGARLLRTTTRHGTPKARAIALYASVSVQALLRKIVSGFFAFNRSRYLQGDVQRKSGKEPMLHRIDHLTKLRAFLQASSAKLDAAAAIEVGCAAALEQSRLAADCRNLDREIASLAARIWKPTRYQPM